MFWIPIAAIALVFWYCHAFADAVKTSGYQRGYDMRRAQEEKFSSLTRDSELEQKLRWDFEDRKIDCNAVVREFMGGDPKWEQYAGGNTYGETKAKMVLMAKQGKFPSSSAFFSLGSVNPKIRLTNKQWTDMNAEFLMKLQNHFRKQLNRNVVLHLSYNIYDGKSSQLVSRTLQECISRGETEHITWAAVLAFRIEQERIRRS